MTAIEQNTLKKNYMHRDKLLHYWNKRIQFLPGERIETDHYDRDDRHRPLA